MSDKDTDLYLDAGKIIVFSNGEYSDYGYCGMYVTLQPLLRSVMAEAKEEVEKEWLRLDEEQDNWTKESGLPYPVTGDKQELFQTALIKRGLLMIIDYTEAHIGSYGGLDLP